MFLSVFTSAKTIPTCICVVSQIQPDTQKNKETLKKTNNPCNLKVMHKNTWFISKLLQNIRMQINEK